MSRNRNIYIGTSGWIYSDWEKIFYSPNLSSLEKLKYYSKHFSTVEINYSFYHSPKINTFENWGKAVPENFLFAVKVNRFITHIKRLKGIELAWKNFLGNAMALKEKLGPLLFQFPPSFHADSENLERVKGFLQYQAELKVRNVRLAFEFRHKTWCNEETYSLLKRYNVAWVIADSSRYPKAVAVTADFIYLRMHGPKELFSSKYAEHEMKTLANKIKEWLSQQHDIYVYFNNDFHGFAVENAKELFSFIKR